MTTEPDRFRAGNDLTEQRTFGGSDRTFSPCRPCVEEHFVDARAPARGIAQRDELLRDDDGVV